MTVREQDAISVDAALDEAKMNAFLGRVLGDWGRSRAPRW